MREQWDFPFEREAAAGAPVPEGLSLADRMAYTELRNLYWGFNAGSLDRERAGADKRRLRFAWEQAKKAEAFERKLTDYHVRLIRASEQAVIRCRKNPAAENALYLCDVLDGIEKPGDENTWS